MLGAATRAGLIAQVTISAGFGCPFEGVVPPARVVDLAERMAAAGAVEIALADTVGVAVPAQVADLFGAVAAVVPGVRLRAHFQDTRGTGIANAWAAYRAGVQVLDASVGGPGGCPFAPKATGNIATEDLLYLLDNSGVRTGIDLTAMIGANRRFADVLGRPLPLRVARAAPD
jgi:hydroxymethylglutaryl-CoA lyase